ncbi:MAG: hypothetical protein MZV63_25135 [Marinilabiliales bacterium]|nr:hypothetical protein [Marinilabiliales bacterium]
MEVTGVLIADLDGRIKEAPSGVTNGVVTPVTLDVLRAEKIKAGQQLTELTRRRHDRLSCSPGTDHGNGRTARTPPFPLPEHRHLR